MLNPACLFCALCRIILTYLVLPFILLFVALGIGIKTNQFINHWWFSFLFTKILEPLFGNKFDSVREKVFKGIQLQKSHDSELRKKNAIRVLEIGTGNGPNFQYYPENVHYISVDPNATFMPMLKKNQDKYKGIVVEKILSVMGENMDEIPDDSIDAVVITHVLCSVIDQSVVLKQIYRVLAKVNFDRKAFT